MEFPPHASLAACNSSSELSPFKNQNSNPQEYLTIMSLPYSFASCTLVGFAPIGIPYLCKVLIKISLMSLLQESKSNTFLTTLERPSVGNFCINKKKKILRTHVIYKTDRTIMIESTLANIYKPCQVTRQEDIHIFLLMFALIT